MTTTADSPAIAPSSAGSTRRVVWASFVGTALESFDFYVYAYFAAFFVGPLFFEPLGTFGATLTAFLTIGISYVVRPLGAIVFGHLGDRIGRRKTLLVTIAIMGVATGLIGVLPTYAVAGWFGAVVLVILRLAQGISLGGEWGGAILLATEHSDSRRRAFWAAFPQLGSPVGSILSAVAFLVLTFVMSAEELAAWGWRIPFLLAIPLLLVSLYLRWSIDETPVFKNLVATDRRDRIPFLAMFKRQPVVLLIAVGVSLLGIGSYSLMNTYTVNYGVAVLGFSYQDLLIATTIGGLLQLITIPTFGWLATKIGSARVVAIGAAGTLLIAFPMYFLLQFSTFGILVATMIIGGILPTLSWAALGGLMSDLFDDDFRYSALSVAYSVGALISGFVPAATGVLAEATANAWWHPGIVLAIMSAITLVASIAAARVVAARGTEPVTAVRSDPVSA
ncbi:MFS transporter [Herbiconiux sp. L3-i23]|uniref:MFS transporter n=1 Tax=Herbiconiux sp. L3-i23 TaxID=2905871 RepID=UPI00205CCBFE|nr:MFS transporter [Herbiconiux sp. L3-i23]BDI23174.1 MFS transporter [Herbiconiux sp. L3-i23]